MISEIYSLDGTDVDFTPTGAQPGTKGKRKAKWLPDGRGVFIEEVTTSDSPKGPVTRQVARKWTLSSDGNTLTRNEAQDVLHFHDRLMELGRTRKRIYDDGENFVLDLQTPAVAPAK